MDSRRASFVPGEEPRRMASGPGAVLKVSETEGGAIDLSDLERFVYLAGGDRAVIVVIPTAAANPARSGEDHAMFCRRFGAAEATWLQVWQRGDANSAAAISRLERATGILLVGNDVARWRQALADTRLLDAIHRRNAEGAVIAATNAGLSLMPPGVVAALNLVDVDLRLLSDPGVDPHIEWLGF
jgi:cyanophycinase